MNAITEPDYPSAADIRQSRDRLLGAIAQRSRARRRRLAIAAATVVLAVGAAGAAAVFFPIHPQVTAGQTTGSTDGSHSGASWAEWYRTFPQLKTHSDLVVLGTFTRVLDQSSLKGIPMTDFEFTVQRAFLDNGHTVTAGTTLTVHQTGAQGAGTANASDDPLFKVSETNILFLRRADDGRYFVAGGPTGRFEVQGGQVTPITKGGVQFSGTIDDFSAALAGS